ncbi:MAG: cobalamin-binding protein [Steroidobacteraceae bacterium]|nr:cobalamin-binding protein [Steroidobacteraceae bacterium]MDW8258694.1 cobalamin-binding protein [Gammaproteobacteria bacterium]
MRIVSLLPSATEIICALGLEEYLVGVTHECDFPAFVDALPKVTRTLIPSGATSAEIDRLVRERLRTNRALYMLDLPMLEALRPDLLVTQALCDVCAVAEEEVRAAACELPGSPRVVNLQPQTLHDVFASIRQVAEAAGVERRADALIARLTQRVEAVATRSARRRVPPPRVALLEWLDPPFCCGHWSPELVRLAGGTEGLGRAGQPSRTLRWEDVCAFQPQVVFIACCGFTVERTLFDVERLAEVPSWRELPACRAGEVYVTDGAQYFSRPGPRLVDSLEMLAHTLDPTLHPLPADVPPPVRLTASPAAGRAVAVG